MKVNVLRCHLERFMWLFFVLLELIFPLFPFELTISQKVGSKGLFDIHTVEFESEILMLKGSN